MKNITLTIALLLAGCVSSGTQVKDSALQQFQKGVTTEPDVVKALGPPQQTTTNGQGRILTYVGVHAQANAASYIPIVGLFAGRSTVNSSAVSFTFDRNGKLSDIASTQGQTSASLLNSSQEQAPAPSVVK